jgi:hypothetical protein
VVVLLLPLSLAIDSSEFDNGGSISGGGGLAAVAPVARVVAVDNREDVQWRRWQGRLMAVAVLVARFNGGGEGQ